METTKNKGISPLTAITMLIAITLSVATIISVWGTSFMREQLTGIKESHSKMTACQNTRINVDTIVYDHTEEMIIMTIQNTGTTELHSFVIYTYNESSPITTPNTNVPRDKDTIISTESVGVIRIDGITTNPSKIRVHSMVCPQKVLCECTRNNNKNEFACN